MLFTRKSIDLPTPDEALPGRDEPMVGLDPRGTIADFGVTLPENQRVRVWDSTAETRFIVIPMRPAGTEGWSEEKLASIVSRDSMIGTGLPRVEDAA